MNWIWLNAPLGALITLAVAGIPLWMLIKHPDAGPERAAHPGPRRADDRERPRERVLVLLP
jgi:hypothetical protein